MKFCAASSTIHSSSRNADILLGPACILSGFKQFIGVLSFINQNCINQLIQHSHCFTTDRNCDRCGSSSSKPFPKQTQSSAAERRRKRGGRGSERGSERTRRASRSRGHLRLGWKPEHAGDGRTCREVCPGVERSGTRCRRVPDPSDSQRSDGP